MHPAQAENPDGAMAKNWALVSSRRPSEREYELEDLKTVPKILVIFLF